jgi:hypothetical protein
MPPGFETENVSCPAEGAPAAEPEPGDSSNGDCCHLTRGSGQKQHEEHGEKGNACALPVGSKSARHTPDGLRHHRDGDDLDAVEERGPL